MTTHSTEPQTESPLDRDLVPCPHCGGDGFEPPVPGHELRPCHLCYYMGWVPEADAMKYREENRSGALSDRFRRLLATHHLTIAELAEAAGMSRQAAWAVITGKVPNPTILTVERLVEAAGGTMREFYAEEEPPR